MKPITYWVQNEAIDQLVKRYGQYLEKLTRFDRRLLIALISLSCFEDATVEMHLFLATFLPHIPRSKQVEKVLDILQASHLKVTDADRLIEAIAATLAYAPQKTGTPAA